MTPGRAVRRLLRMALLAIGCVLAAPAPAADCPPAAAELSPEALSHARATAADRGLLWRLEKDGRSSWLYGTLHVGKAEWLLPGPRVRQALRDSDTLALELDFQDPATLAALTAPMDAASRARLLTPQRQGRLARQAGALCLSEEALAKQRPIFQAMALALQAIRFRGLHVEYGNEAMLQAVARRTGKQVVGLETVATQLLALAGDSEEEEGEQTDQVLDSLESGQFDTLTGQLAEAWAQADLSRLERYAQWCDCVRTPAEQRAMARLLDQRNPGLADGLARLHAQGQRVFGAVGALHMTGPQGLPALLAARGFRVTQVVPALGDSP